MTEREYIKLTPPRQRGGFAVVSTCRSNLWLAKDHVLCVETEGYTESYRRFYFRDIQAITLRKTRRYFWWTAFLVPFALFFLIMTFASVLPIPFARWTAQDQVKLVLFVIFAFLFVSFLLVNVLRGPTCACQLRTAVQTENMPSMGRIRRARKVIARLRPLIAEAQGQITAEEIPLRFQELVSSPAAPGDVPPHMTT